MSPRFPFINACLDALKHPSSYSGAAMIALLWIATGLLISSERQAALEAVSQDTSNLAHAFEENVVRTVHEIDRSLLILRRSYKPEITPAEWVEKIRETDVSSETTLQLAVIDADGYLVATNQGAQPPRTINLSDRVHFNIHATADDDRSATTGAPLARGAAHAMGLVPKNGRRPPCGAIVADELANMSDTRPWRASRSTNQPSTPAEYEWVMASMPTPHCCAAATSASSPAS